MISLLYVDDEPALLDLCKIFLEKTGEFSLTTQGSAIGATGILEEEPFDAIICDVNPDGSAGFDYISERCLQVLGKNRRR